MPKASYPNTVNGTATDDLFVVTQAISAAIFGGRLSPRQVYRLASEKMGWRFFRVRGKIACRRSRILAHIEQLEAEDGV